MTQAPVQGSTPTVPVPDLSGKYRPIAELGRGGMATVYLVVAQGPGGFNKLQVVKLLHPELAGDSEFVEMFLQEARLASRLSHPNVVQTYDIGFDGKSYGIVMEYLEGQSFEAILRRGEKLAKTEGDGAKMPISLQLRIMVEMLHGLGYAHDLADFDGKPLSIVHRDVTPHNVIVTYDGHVKLVDFGIAKAADSNGQTRAGVIKGKVAYMAPEQFGGMKIDRRADLFAVGIMLWQIATGQRMWRGLSETDIFKKLAEKAIPTPRSVNPAVPEELEAICMKALQYHPDDRYQTAGEFQHALEEYIAKSERVTSQQLGGWVAKTFADARTRVKTSVEQRLKDLRAPTKGPIVGSSPDVSVFASQSMSLVQPTPSTPVAVVGVPTAAASQPAGGVGWKYVIPAAALLGLSVVAYAATRKPAVSSPAEAATVEGEKTTVSIDVTPPEAKLFLDDMPLTGRSIVRARDGLSHRIRADAPGYASAGQIVVFDSTMVNVALVLEKEGAAAPSGKPSASAPPTATTQTGWVPPPTRPTGGTTATPPGPTTTTATARPTATATAEPGRNPPVLDQDPWKK